MLIRVGDLDTHFIVWGEGRPVVLLHGWGTSAESLSVVAKALEDRCQVYAVDLPGFGWTPSAATTWGTWEYASYVEAFMDRIGIPTADLIGHSFGGRVALVLAAQRPDRVRRLILAASAGIRPRRGLLLRVKVGSVKLAKRLFLLPVWGRLGERIVAELYRRIGSRDYRNAGPMRATLVKVVGEDLRGILSSIRVPTLIIWGGSGSGGTFFFDGDHGARHTRLAIGGIRRGRPFPVCRSTGPFWSSGEGVLVAGQPVMRSDATLGSSFVGRAVTGLLPYVAVAVARHLDLIYLAQLERYNSVRLQGWIVRHWGIVLDAEESSSR